MNTTLTENEAIFRFSKIFVAQYLSSMHNFDSFHDEALNLLALFLIKIIKRLALKVKSILNLQGRTLPNPLHLLVVAEQSQTVDFIKLLQFIGKSRDIVYDMKSLDVIQRLGNSLFQNDLELINNYPRDTSNSNLKWVPPVYTYDLSKKALPYRHPIDEVLPLPPEVTYRETQQKIIRERRNIEHLASYTRRENRLAIVGKMIGEEARAGEKAEEAEDEELTDRFYGVGAEKKQKFDLISFL